MPRDAFFGAMRNSHVSIKILASIAVDYEEPCDITHDDVVTEFQPFFILVFAASQGWQ